MIGLVASDTDVGVHSCSYNVARDCPNQTIGAMGDMWVFVVGPFAGSAMAVVLHKFPEVCEMIQRWMFPGSSSDDEGNKEEFAVEVAVEDPGTINA